jgi:hypothetical protein
MENLPKISSFLAKNFQIYLPETLLKSLEEIARNKGFKSTDLQCLWSEPNLQNLDIVVQIQSKDNRPKKNYTDVEYLFNFSINAAIVFWIDCEITKNAISEKIINYDYTRYILRSYAQSSAYNAAVQHAKHYIELSDSLHRACVLLGEYINSNFLLHLDRNKQGKYTYGFLGVSYLTLSYSSSGDNREELLTKAVKSIKTSIDFGNTRAEAYANLGEAISELCDFRNQSYTINESIDFLRECLRQDPGNIKGRNTLARALIQRSSTKINYQTDKAIQRDPNTDLEEAINIYRQLLNETNSYKLGNLKGRIGQAILYLCWNGESKNENLDEAVDFLRDAFYSGEFQWVRSLSEALIVLQSNFDEPVRTSLINEAWTHLNNEGVKKLEKTTKYDYSDIRMRVAYLFGKHTRNEEILKSSLKEILDKESEIYLKTETALALISEDIELLNSVEYKLKSTNFPFKGIYPKVATTLAEIIKSQDRKRAVELYNSAIQFNETNRDDANIEVISINIRSLFKQWKLSGENLYLEKAADSTLQYLSTYGLSIENKILFADVLLQAYKQLKDNNYLEEAYKIYDAIEPLEELRILISDLDFPASVYQSKLGEVFYRVGALQRNSDQLLRAKNFLEESFKLGNQTSELCGMLGDCYYRLFIYSRNNLINYLNSALEWKEHSRKLNRSTKESPEHFSLCAKLEFLKFQITREKSSLDNFFRHLKDVRSLDQDWPWPVCQLAEFTGSISEFSDPELSIEECLKKSPKDRSLSLHLIAAKKILSSNEINLKKIGISRNSVSFGDDKHNLVSTVYVYKSHLVIAKIIADNREPSTEEVKKAINELENEYSRLTEVQSLLKQKNIDVDIPEKIGIENSTKLGPVLIMRRLNGQTLAALIKYNRLSVETHLHKALEVLATYHANFPFNHENTDTSIFRNREKHLRLENNKMFERWKSLAEKFPIVPRRDAHPGNWFITFEGREEQLVIIDIEEPKGKPFLEDLIQLIEDELIYDLQESNNLIREKLILEYCQIFQKSGNNPRVIDINFELYETKISLLNLYWITCIIYANMMLGNIKNKTSSRGSMSFSENENLNEKSNHYNRLINYARKQICI